jgi:hypothetical protein
VKGLGAAPGGSGGCLGVIAARGTDCEGVGWGCLVARIAVWELLTRGNPGCSRSHVGLRAVKGVSCVGQDAGRLLGRR